MSAMTGWGLTAAVLSATLVWPAQAQEVDKGKPRLVARGQGYFVHAVPQGLRVSEVQKPGLASWMTEDDLHQPDLPRMFGRLRNPYQPGLALLHTSTASGEMKSLLTTGAYELLERPKKALRTSRLRTRIVGTAADSSRLYVAWWYAEEAEDWDFHGRPYSAFGKGRYRLTVFHLADGKQLQEVELKKESPPKEPPEEKVGRGPLQVREHGVSCFGVSFILRDGRLVEAPHDGKQ